MSTTFNDLLKEVATEHDRELLALREEIQLLHQQIQRLKFIDEDDEVPCERRASESNGFLFQATASDSYVVSSNSKDSRDFNCFGQMVCSKPPEMLDAVELQKPRLPEIMDIADPQKLRRNFRESSSLKSNIKAQKEQIKQQMTARPKIIVSLDSNMSGESWQDAQGRRKVSLAPQVKEAGKNMRKSNATIDDNSTVIDVEESAEDMLTPEQHRWTIGSSGFSSYDFMEADANGYKHANELRKWFSFLDFSRKRFLTPKDIHALIVKVEGSAKKSLEWIERTVESLNVTLSVMPNHCLKTTVGLGYSNDRSDRLGRSSTHSHQSSFADCPKDSDLQFPGFVELIIWDNFSQFATDVGAVLYLRDILIKASVEELVVKASHLQIPTAPLKNPFILTVLEPIVACVVFANALSIGLSQDITWKGWYSMEIAFTIFFIGEILIKVAICGVCEHFWNGDDARWNIFDSMLVLVAVTDLVLTETGKENTIGDAMVIRLVRLARLTRLLRLIRLLRLSFFKELLLMIKGVIAGMRTLFWAFVLMLVTMYVVAVGLRQSDMKDESGDIIFKSLGWSMFTVFVCFTGECTLLDGTPLPLLLFGRYTWKFAVPFTIANIGIGFGLFNLVMAIFVENVNESSKQKRQLSNEEERAKVCRNLRDLIMKFGGMSSKMEAAARFASINKRRRKHRASLFVNVSTRITRLTTLIRGNYYLGKSVRSTGLHSSPEMSSTAGHVDIRQTYTRASTDHVHFQFGGQITREVFQDRISDIEVQEMLDDLDVHVGDRTEIFDIVDTEMTGFVEVSDLVAGLLKLRSGGADKSDIVSALLGIRSLRKQLNTFMERVLDNQVQLLSQMEDNGRALKGAYEGDSLALSDGTPVASVDTSVGSPVTKVATPPAAQRNASPTRTSRFSFASPRCSHSEAVGRGSFARESWCRPSFISVTPRLSNLQRASALRQSARKSYTK